MKNNFEKLDLSFLPEKLAEEAENRLKKALAGLEKIKWPIKAVVLGGGYKHKEITFSEQGIGSDIDLFVFSSFIPFFWKKLTRIQDELNKDKFFFHYRGVIPLFLSKSKTFWAYKLKNEGIVLKGNKNILKKIRASENNIPKEEAIRVLLQGLVGWTKASGFRDRKSSLFSVLRIYLNIGESYLTFFGCLRPSYRERLKEFQNRAGEFGINEELRNRVVLGYLTKTNPDRVRRECEEYNLSLEQAKDDCLKQAEYLLSLYLGNRALLEENLDVLAKRTRPKPLFNFAFFWALRDLKELKPKFFPVVFKFKITDLYKIVFYSQRGEQEKMRRLLERYFYIRKFSEESLIRFLTTCFLPTMVQVA
jgi:hypothetical protein